MAIIKAEFIRNFLANAGLIVILAVVLVVAFYFYGVRMPGVSYSGPLPALSADSEKLRDRLSEHVRVLSMEIGERHPGKIEQLVQAADYIEDQFTDFTYVPKSELINDKGYRNIVVDLYGRQDRNKILLVGAHYDTTWMTAGADDNASGVAALLEIARAFRSRNLPITIRFVAFANEE